MVLPATIALLILYSGLFIYYWIGWKSLKDFIPLKKHNYKFLSVIVPARNEERNIPILLNALSKQNYPFEFFEVIVIDDFSTDDTANVVKRFSFSNLNIIQPSGNASSSSKKKAIEAGIHIAKGELIITTDADCIPGKDWLSSINNFYQHHNAVFIAAPVKFLSDGSLLQVFQSLDFLTLQGITAASVASNFHTMCNGANLAYTKQAFKEVDGFNGIDRIATGDDMLLMHKIWKRHTDKVLYLKSKEAIVTTQPMLTWKDLFMQRKRWASKSLVYDDFRIVFVLILVLLVNCSFIGLIIAFFFDTSYWWYVLGFWVAKAVIEFPFVYSVASFYGEQKLMKYFFFFQPLHIIYTVLIGILSQFGKYEWKGRKTK